MTLMYFDTFKCVKLLVEAGFNQKQAEAINEAQMTNIQTLLSQVATKAEMHAEFQKVRSEIKDVRHELKAYVHKSTTTILITMITLAGVILAGIPFLESLNL
ncbi:MAG: hypothetical protein WC748_08915 [Legionellales bacterium]